MKHTVNIAVLIPERSQKLFLKDINMPAKLRKSHTDKMVAGVCGGIAEYLGWDSTIIRIIFLILVFSSVGSMVLLYFILALIMPD
ncbi:PspC domain-containing protein [Rhodohalobacter mucosus]|nr:PspC domain-containing protein [Rhodohalobacter mucosus]